MTNLGSLTNGGDGIVTADSVPTLPPGIVVSNFGIDAQYLQYLEKVEKRFTL